MTPRGTFVAVVGPSGAGKDTLIDAALAARPDLRRARRAIAPPRAAVGEDAEPMEPAAFDAAEARGAFALSWRAHGLRYGVPAAVEADLAAGRCVLANLSRGVLDAARARFAPFRAVLVTAPPTVLAERLAARGREDAEAIAARLARAGPDDPDAIHVDNGGTLADGTAAFLAALPSP